MKRRLLLPILFIAACSPTETPLQAPAADTFRAALQADYPVTLSPIADGVWVHTTHYRIPNQPLIASNGLAVVDGQSVTLVDGAWGELATIALIDAVEAETGLEVTRMVVTHHHADRTQGVDAAEREGIEIFTHPDTPGLAARAGWPVPDTSVAGLAEPGSRGRVGRIEIAYPGPGHAPDNIVAYLPDESILYAGCAVRGAGVGTLGNVEDANLSQWRESLQWLKVTYPDTQTVVPGHGKGSGLSLIDGTVALIDAELAPPEGTQND